MNGTENTWLVKFGEPGADEGGTPGDDWSFALQPSGIAVSAAMASIELTQRVRPLIFLTPSLGATMQLLAPIEVRRTPLTVRLIRADHQS
ncbi:hypothetical protein ACGFIF_24055 [Kribbella sp. NPDC049174]|uniref:hypothetical protein n=1 Tax=Kribbella sp. NPDC049174 TaxID=3364112 RepID=UPI0037179C04